MTFQEADLDKRVAEVAAALREPHLTIEDMFFRLSNCLTAIELVEPFPDAVLSSKSIEEMRGALVKSWTDLRDVSVVWTAVELRRFDFELIFDAIGETGIVYRQYRRTREWQRPYLNRTTRTVADHEKDHGGHLFHLRSLRRKA